jgi:hypothetical protein
LAETLQKCLDASLTAYLPATPFIAVINALDGEFYTIKIIPHTQKKKKPSSKQAPKLATDFRHPRLTTFP